MRGRPISPTTDAVSRVFNDGTPASLATLLPPLRSAARPCGRHATSRREHHLHAAGKMEQPRPTPRPCSAARRSSACAAECQHWRARVGRGSLHACAAPTSGFRHLATPACLLLVCLLSAARRATLGVPGHGPRCQRAGAPPAARRGLVPRLGVFAQDLDPHFATICLTSCVCVVLVQLLAASLRTRRWLGASGRRLLFAQHQHAES